MGTWEIIQKLGAVGVLLVLVIGFLGFLKYLLKQHRAEREVMARQWTKERAEFRHVIENHMHEHVNETNQLTLALTEMKGVMQLINERLRPGGSS